MLVFQAVSFVLTAIFSPCFVTSFPSEKQGLLLWLTFAHTSFELAQVFAANEFTGVAETPIRALPATRLEAQT